MHSFDGCVCFNVKYKIKKAEAGFWANLNMAFSISNLEANSGRFRSDSDLETGVDERKRAEGFRSQSSASQTLVDHVIIEERRRM